MSARNTFVRVGGRVVSLVAGLGPDVVLVALALVLVLAVHFAK
jgi:hypothetical protein